MTYIRDTAPLAEPVCDPFYERAMENLSFEQAMSLPVVDPVAERHFAQCRAYGELLLASLGRTDDMLAPCFCGMAKAFCACPANPKPVEAVR